MNIFLWSFIILTILHPIGDFSLFTNNRKLHYLIVLNPLHFLWDKSPFRQHQKYIKGFQEIIRQKDGKWSEISWILNHPNPKDLQQAITNIKFWRWLAVDQLAHVLLNLIFAWFLGFLL